MWLHCRFNQEISNNQTPVKRCVKTLNNWRSAKCEKVLICSLKKLIPGNYVFVYPWPRHSRVPLCFWKPLFSTFIGRVPLSCTLQRNRRTPETPCSKGSGGSCTLAIRFEEPTSPGEHIVHIDGVTGSSPTNPTNASEIWEIICSEVFLCICSERHEPQDLTVLQQSCNSWILQSFVVTWPKEAQCSLLSVPQRLPQPVPQPGLYAPPTVPQPPFCTRSTERFCAKRRVFYFGWCEREPCRTPAWSWCAR